MAYTQSDLDAINATIKSGDLLVDYGDRKIRYRDLDDLYRIRRDIENSIAIEAGNRPSPLSRHINVPVRNL